MDTSKGEYYYCSICKATPPAAATAAATAAAAAAAATAMARAKQK